MLSRDVLRIDPGSATRAIERSLHRNVFGILRRKGIVVGVSGGVDSALVATLAERALGAEHVLALLMPERDSSPKSLELGRLMARHLDVPAIVEDLGPALEGIGCYARQDDAIRSVFSEYSAAKGWSCKLRLPSILDSDRVNGFTLTVSDPSGQERTSRMPAWAYGQLVSATNFKQRARRSMEYYHADRLGYAVAGTPNLLEYDQGCFVKQGDGAADVKPIAHLYKTQVYQLAAYLGVPESIRRRRPTTDTFSMEQTHEEASIALPYESMDLCIYARDHGLPAEEVAPTIGLTTEQVARVFRDIDAKRRTTRYLRAQPLFTEAEIATSQ